MLPIEMRGKYSDGLAANRRSFIHGEVVADVATGKEIVRLEGAGGQSFAPHEFSADGTQVIGTIVKIEEKKGGKMMSFGGVRVWETATGKPIADIHPKSWVGQTGVHPNHRLAFISDYDGITIWDLATKKPVFKRPMPEAIRSSTTRGTYESCVALSPNGSRMATGHPDGTILIWDLPIKLTPLEPIDAKTLETMWTVLEGADAAKAWQLIWRLAESPAQVLSALRKRLKPIQVMTVEQLQPMIAGLDNDEFARREQAMKQTPRIGSTGRGRLARSKQRQCLSGTTETDRSTSGGHRRSQIVLDADRTRRSSGRAGS